MKKLSDLIDKAVRPRLNAKFDSLIKVGSDDQIDTGDQDTWDDPGDRSLSGLALVFEYQDSKGNVSQRVVTCKQFAVRANREYIHAFCHQRNAPRAFRLDRIIDIFDPETGESLSPVQAFFSQFSPDQTANSGLSWGLSVSRRADLIALLNALVFVARCDKEFHATERRCLENALTGFWLRLEVPGDPDFNDILNYADRLAPDGEIFWVAMHRFKEEPALANLFQRHATQLIEADGVIRQEEAYWAVEIDEFLRA